MNREDRYDSLIVYYSSVYNRIPRQVKRQIRSESNFNPDAISKVGAKGLAQFMDATWREWWDGTAGIEQPSIDLIHFSPYDPEDSIRSMCAYMAAIQKSFGTIEKSLAAYNWGPGNMRKLLASNPSDLISHLPSETRAYVLKNSSFLTESLVG